MIYKLISKIIVNMNKLVLSKTLSCEQFVFLHDRKIMDAIGIMQEVVHSIKQKKMKALLLKMDLEKYFDRADWDLLRLSLIQTGMPLLVVKWIMACVTSAHFVVMVNGASSSFFKSGRWIRHGCPLSPLLFLPTIEGLSRLILDSKTK